MEFFYKNKIRFVIFLLITLLKVVKRPKYAEN